MESGEDLLVSARSHLERKFFCKMIKNREAVSNHAHMMKRLRCLGKCCAKETVSTSTDSVCPAKNSATSRSAKMKLSASSIMKEEKQNPLASLGNEVVYGCPPLPIRICNRVSLKSLPAMPPTGAAGTGAGTDETPAELSGSG